MVNATAGDVQENEFKKNENEAAATQRQRN